MCTVTLRWRRSGPRRMRPERLGRRPSRLAPLAPQGDGYESARRSLMSEFKSPALKGAGSIRHAPPRRATPTGVLHFSLSVADLERARRFYEDIVGCTFWRSNDTTVFMRCGGDYITLSRTGYHSSPNRG